MDAALLPCAHADGLAVHRVAYGVGLGVLQGDEGNDQVPPGLLRQIGVGGDNVLQQVRADLELVAALLEGNAEHVLGLLRGGDIMGVDPDDVVPALPLCLQNLQGLVGVAGGDDAVGHLPLDQSGGGRVAHVAQRRPVAEGAQAVRPPSPGVGAGQGAAVQLRHVVHKTGLLEGPAQGQAHGGGGGGDVLEGGGGGQACGLLQLLHQLPGVEGVQEINIPGLAVEDLQGQVPAVLHKDAGGLLVGVAAVFQL